WFVGQTLAGTSLDGVSCRALGWHLEVCGNGIDDDGDGQVDEAGTANNANGCVPDEALDGDGVPDWHDLDTDGDGAPDALEPGGAEGDGVPDHRDLGSDGDGILDVLEIADGLDADGGGRVDGPVGANGLADAVELWIDQGVLDYDGDGEPDVLRDSDGDGVPDLRSLDSDGDGLSDQVEDLDLDGIVDPGESDPRLADSDGDGLADGDEVSRGTDPLASDSDGDGLAD